jgi:hypothetical protein
MTSVPHEPGLVSREQPQWIEALKITEMWAALSITMMWLAVLFDAVYGPNFVSTSAGGDSTTIPSALGVAFFAFLGTVSVAKYGFRHDRQ